MLKILRLDKYKAPKECVDTVEIAHSFLLGSVPQRERTTVFRYQYSVSFPPLISAMVQLQPGSDKLEVIFRGADY